MDKISNPLDNTFSVNKHDFIACAKISINTESRNLISSIYIETSVKNGKRYVVGRFRCWFFECFMIFLSKLGVLYLSFLVLFASVVSSANVGDPCAPEDPYTYGLYAPHPYDCSQYLQCKHYAFIARSCSPGLHWSVEENACDWPALANCNVGTAPPTPTTTSDPAPPPSDETTETDDGEETTENEEYTTETDEDATEAEEYVIETNEGDITDTDEDTTADNYRTNRHIRGRIY